MGEGCRKRFLSVYWYNSFSSENACCKKAKTRDILITFPYKLTGGKLSNKSKIEILYHFKHNIYLFQKLFSYNVNFRCYVKLQN